MATHIHQDDAFAQCARTVWISIGAVAAIIGDMCAYEHNGSDTMPDNMVVEGGPFTTINGMQVQYASECKTAMK